VSALQLVWNAEKIAIALIVIIKTTPNTLNSTRTSIPKREKLLRNSSLGSTKAALVESQGAQRNIASVTKLDCSVEKSASVSSVRITSLLATKR
jgi:hypothetical protein